MAVIVMALSMWISSVIYDYSADGQWYHMPAAYALSHGWNPVYVHHNPIIAEAHHANLWIDHYSKGMETLAATVIALTGNVESGKAVNMIMLLVTLCLSFSVLRNPYFFGLSLRKSIFYSLVIGFCPIVNCELFTSYIDLAVYFCIVWLMIGFILLYEVSYYSLIFCLAIVYLGGSIKLNLMFWMGYMTFFYLAYLFFRKRRGTFKKLL